MSFIGDSNCKYNALKPNLRCAVNPSGPCGGCTDFGKITRKDRLIRWYLSDDEFSWKKFSWVTVLSLTIGISFGTALVFAFDIPPILHIIGERKFPAPTTSATSVSNE